MITFKSKDTNYTLHFRYERETVPANLNKERSKSHKRPRHTVCIIKKEGTIIAKNRVSCCSKDHFTYTIGRKLALTGALAKVDFDYATRKNVWDALLSISK